MKKIKSMLLAVLVLLAVVLGTGCGQPAGDAPPPTGSTAQSGAESAQSLPPGQQQGWSAAFYRAVEQNLTTPQGFVAAQLMLYRWQGGAPILAIGYANPEGPNAPYLDVTEVRVFVYRQGAAALLGEDEGWLAGINTENGNPVVCRITLDETGTGAYRSDYYELAGEEKTFLFYTEVDENSEYRLVLGDAVYSRAEEHRHEPLADLPIDWRGEVLELRPYDTRQEFGQAPMLLRAAEFLGYSPYRPQLPEGAPAWVEAYIAYIHNRLFFTHAPTATITNKGDWQELSFGLLPPPGEGLPPVLQAGGLVQNAVGSSMYFPTQTGMLDMANGIDTGWGLKRAADGRMLVFTTDYGRTEVYTLDEGGLHRLLRGGFNYYEPPYRYYQEDWEFFESHEQVEGNPEEWVQQRLEQGLAALGYQGLEWTAPFTIALPNMFSYNELEKLLVEAFCEYARQIGQMQG